MSSRVTGGNRTDDLEALFPGESELAALCRDMDWSRTPLGPAAGWPPAMATMVRTILPAALPICTWWGDDLIVIYNDAYKRLLGSKHPAALGRPVDEVWSEIWIHLRPMVETLRAGGPTPHAEDQLFTVQRGGTAEEAYFSYSLSAVRDEAGRMIGLLNLATDTTARVLANREAGAAREEAERVGRRMREIFEQAPVAVCVIAGPAHVYELVNPNYQRFFPGRKLEGLPILEALPELEGQGVVEMLDRVRRSRRPHVESAYRIQVDREGTGRLEEGAFSFVYQPLHGDDGEVDSIVVVATDVTELVQARAAADEARRIAETANAAKSEFLAMMSHELRTPLNAIGGYAELLEIGVHGAVSPPQLEALGRIQASQRHLLGLINSVLNYAKLEAGQVHFDIRPTSVAETLRQVEALMNVQARSRDVGFAVEEVSEGLRVAADAEKLRQILLNLLSNAIKFTEAGGRVELSCAEDAKSVRLTVSDTGRGIPEHELERIFEPFVQIGRDLMNPGEGTGLGLAISYDLAIGMSGELHATSELGEGSAFTLTLPREP